MEKYQKKPEAEMDKSSVQSIETAPKNGQLISLLVDHTVAPTWTPFEDENIGWTIGFNSYEHTGDDLWEIVGWDWQQDEYANGTGKILGWRPFDTVVPSEYTNPTKEP